MLFMGLESNNTLDEPQRERSKQLQKIRVAINDLFDSALISMRHR